MSALPANGRRNREQHSYLPHIAGRTVLALAKSIASCSLTNIQIGFGRSALIERFDRFKS
jgi:hypothetical protein